MTGQYTRKGGGPVGGQQVNNGPVGNTNLHVSASCNLPHGAWGASGPVMTSQSYSTQQTQEVHDKAIDIDMSRTYLNSSDGGFFLIKAQINRTD